MTILATNVRKFLNIAVAMGKQSAKGVPVTNFVGKTPLWTPALRMDEGVHKLNFQGTHGDIWEHKAGRAIQYTTPSVILRTKATPAILHILLECVAGSWDNNTVVFSKVIPSYYTLAWRDNAASAALSQVFSLSDGTIKRLTLSSNESGQLECEFEFLAEKIMVESLGSTSITMPNAPPNETTFNHRGLVHNYNDTSVDFAMRSYAFIIDHQIIQWLGPSTTPTLIKQGFTQVTSQFSGRYSDEYRQSRDDARLLNFKEYRAVYSGSPPTITLSINMKSLDFNIVPLVGFENRYFLECNCSGRAFYDGTNNPAIISKTGF